MLRETRHRVRLRGARETQRAIANLKSSFVVVILTLLPTLALGQSIRCGSELITRGTSQAKVAALCGQPTQVVRPAVSNGVEPGVSDVEEEIWVYNFGPNKLMQRIQFRNGIVANIDSVEYGY
jgi:hypothetical protein